MLADDRIAAVMSYTSFEGNGQMSRLRFLGIPRSLRNSYLSRDNHTVLLDAVPGEQVDPEAMVDFVHEFRQSLNGRHGREADVLFGGLPGVRADYHNSSSGHLPKVVLLVVSGTFLALAVGFRSLLIPVKAIALNLLSVGAGFGVVKLVFLDGFCLGALGLDQPVSAVFEIVPTLVFCIVFGLSMDYEVFLVARVAEAKRVGHSDRTAIVEGLTHSAPLITSASAIMVVVFGAFALGEFLVIQVLGIALAASIALDAALVRVAVGPALLALAGRWNWWPGIRLDSAPTGGHDVR